MNGFVCVAATGRMAAGDIGDRHASVAENPAGAQHGVDLADGFAHHHAPARDAGTVVIPTMGFYGGLGDLLTTAAAPGWTAAGPDRVDDDGAGWA